MVLADQLPMPNRDTLKHPPLELVVCQVRHEPHSELQDASFALQVQQELGDGFTRMESGSANEISLDPRSVSVQARPSWRITTHDSSWMVTLTLDSFTLESTKYTTWAEFKRRFSNLVSVLDSKLEPKFLQRVGLRYIDRIVRASGRPGEWLDFLNPAFLGLATHPGLRDAVMSSQTYSELRIGDYAAQVRGSCATDKTPSGYSMVLDTDCFTDSAQGFNAESLQSILEDLHTLNLQIFQTALTPELYSELHS